MTDEDKLIVKVVFTGGITSLVPPVDGITPLDAPSGASHACAELRASDAETAEASCAGGAGGGAVELDVASTG